MLITNVLPSFIKLVCHLEKIRSGFIKIYHLLLKYDLIAFTLTVYLIYITIRCKNKIESVYFYICC